MGKHKHLKKLYLTVCGILLAGVMLLSGGCGQGNIEDTTPTTPIITTTTQSAGPLIYINNPLPTWTAGKFNAAFSARHYRVYYTSFYSGYHRFYRAEN